MITETAFEEATDSMLSDVRVYRTTTVLYMLQLFYAEAVIRTSQDEVKINTAHRGRERNWVNMDVFGSYLRDKLVFKLNAKRGEPGLHGLDLMCGMAGRPGKVAGCREEYEQLLKAFDDAQKAFVDHYLRASASTRGVRGASAGAGAGVSTSATEDLSPGGRRRRAVRKALERAKESKEV
jgi:hypothetical protein